ncbi:MAG: hypothetical protein H0V52_07000 [Acidimicrobiia bacterium]|nr:hypothetical protein [Acidimicrobiia bacterium]
MPDWCGGDGDLAHERRGFTEPWEIDGHHLPLGGQAVDNGRPRLPARPQPVDEQERLAGAEADVVQVHGVPSSRAFVVPEGRPAYRR